MNVPQYFLHGVLTAGLLATALAVSPAADETASPSDADALQRKLVIIAINGMAETPQKQQTRVTQQEVNAYLELHGKQELPRGIVDPEITILPGGRLKGRALVDLDAVRESQPRGTMSPWQLLSGRLPVEAVGVLHTRQGVGAFSLESATVGGVPVPKTLLQELVSYYSRSESQPQGVSLDAPFRLPARIREIQTAQGHALVVQ